MIRLDTTTRKLQALLAGAVTTNQLPILVCWSDQTSSAFSGSATPINTNSTLAVDITAAPAASTVRQIDSITVFNADTAVATLTIRYNDNGTTYIIWKATLAVGDQLVYTHGQGWKQLDSAGNTKVTNLSTTSTGTGSVVFSASPTLTGDPLAPTATENDNDTSIATTAFVVANQLGCYRSINNTSKNNAGTPNTQFDLIADYVILKNSNNHVVVKAAPGTITNNVSTAGSTANGRDQVGAFSASSWIHFYWIWDGATLASLSSATAPTTGPTLPSGYTHWSYCGAIRFDGSSHLIKTRIEGAWCFYEARISILASGNATAETAVDCSSVMPPNALEGQAEVLGDNISDGAGLLVLTQAFRVVSGSNFYVLQTQLSGLGLTAATLTPAAVIRFPGISQQFYYLNINTNGTGRLTVTFHGYSIPN